jgi:DNA-directed RNA polymerase subunit beta'
MGYKFAFRGGLSFSLGDIRIQTKPKLVQMLEKLKTSPNYNMGLITNNERYNQVIDVWTSAKCSIDRVSNEKH